VFVAHITHPLVQKRIKDYNTPGAELNEDQKRSVATLPGLEAVVKELEEAKKAIEVSDSPVFLNRSTVTRATDP